ncbi:MAG: hypothetical protein ABI186_09870 [Candidatus Elarobacter sp.]
MRISRPAWGALGAVLIVFLLWLALSKHVYHRTLPHALLYHFFDEDDADTVRIVLRKIYSILAFGALGFVADKTLPRRGSRALRAAIAVAAFSTLIEIGQWLHGTREGLLSNAFDIGCGALGGWLGVLASRALGDRDRPRTTNAREP